MNTSLSRNERSGTRIYSLLLSDFTYALLGGVRGPGRGRRISDLFLDRLRQRDGPLHRNAADDKMAAPAA